MGWVLKGTWHELQVKMAEWRSSLASWPCALSALSGPSQGLGRIPKGLQAVQRQGQVPSLPPRTSGFQTQELDLGKVSRVLRQVHAYPLLRGQQRNTGDMNRISQPFPHSPGVQLPLGYRRRTGYSLGKSRSPSEWVCSSGAPPPTCLLKLGRHQGLGS